MRTNDPTHRLLPVIFDAITQAYASLKDNESRRKYFGSTGIAQKEEVLASQNADEQFKCGVEEFKKGNFLGAADNFKWAIELNEKNAKYWSYLSLAYIKMDKRIEDAEEAMFQAIRLESHNADHYANLGHIYIKAGMKEKAHIQFEKALKIDPENIKAKKGLQQAGA